MAASQSTATKTNEDLQAEMAKLREEMAEITSLVKGMGPSVRDTARAAGRAAAASASELRDKARDYGEASVEATREQVRTHPFMAVGLSFAVGALLALLLRR